MIHQRDARDEEKQSDLLLHQDLVLNRLFIASFPYEYTIELAFNSNPDSNVSQYSKAPRLLRMLKLIRFLRILRLLRVLKLKKILYKIEEYLVTEVLNTFMDIMKLLVLIFFISHWMA